MSDDLGALLEEARALRLSMGHGASNATITVQAGGMAVWISATCCAIMLTAMFFLTLGLYWVAMDSRDRGHQVNAMYQSVPGLRELVEKQAQLNKATAKPAEQEEKP
jgi:hypothetical protein